MSQSFIALAFTEKNIFGKNQRGGSKRPPPIRNRVKLLLSKNWKIALYNYLSKDLLKTGRRETDMQFLICCLLPFL